MHFGSWHPVAEAANVAPPTPGVVQLRAATILEYKNGRTAMVLYACSEADEALSNFVVGRGLAQLHQAEADGACWIRFGEASAPARELERLLRRFAERFGSLPISNVPADVLHA